jgi:hypothetical protein
MASQVSAANYSTPPPDDTLTSCTLLVPRDKDPILITLYSSTSQDSRKSHLKHHPIVALTSHPSPPVHLTCTFISIPPRSDLRSAPEWAIAPCMRPSPATKTAVAPFIMTFVLRVKGLLTRLRRVEKEILVLDTKSMSI